MRLRYGNFRHGIAEADISIRSEPVQDARGNTISEEWIWGIRGRLKNPGGDPATFEKFLIDFELAYSFNGRDLVLELADGRSTYHSLLSRDCIGGTRVTVRPQWPTGRHGEHIYYRSYELEVRGIKPVAGRVSQLTEFSETISIKGGAARFGCMEVNYGPGVRQQLRTHSKCVAVQSGRAVGYLLKPSPPPPIWPFALVDQFPDLDEQNPQTIGSGASAAFINRLTTWSYSYEWPYRLTGSPHFLLG